MAGGFRKIFDVILYRRKMVEIVQRQTTIANICEALDLECAWGNTIINGLNLCNRESEYDRILTYVTSDQYVETIEGNSAVKAIVLSEKLLPIYQALIQKKKLSYILSSQPEKVFYDIHDYLIEHTDFYDKFDFPTVIQQNCNIAPSAVIEKGVVIGENVTVGANTVIRSGTVIGNNCYIGCNTTIGSEGFQILRVEGRNRKIPHCGGVWLGDDVSVGDNVTICKSLFEGATHIGRNAMIDNLSYIAHLVSVGKNAVITAGNMLCGSSCIEEGAWIGVNCSVLNRVKVGQFSKVGMGSVVTRDIPENALAYGVPAKVKRQL